jgi:glycine/D-amino acid oxidase-like deaminating enzyme
VSDGAGGTSPSPDVVIIGGGIVGTSAAAMLAGSGARVLLLEREGLAAGASGANSGVVQHPFDPVMAALYHETLGLYRELAACDLGFRLAPEPAGMLFVSTREAAVRREADLIHRAFPALEVRIVQGHELCSIEPRLAADLWACRVDVGYPVAPGASTYAYATLAESRGAVIRQGRAAELELDGDRVAGVRVDGRMIASGAVLVAAGPWASPLLDPTGRWRPIVPRYGVVVEAELSDPPAHVLEEAGIDAAIGVPDAGPSSTASGGAIGDGSAPDGSAADGATSASTEVEFSLVPLPGASAVGSTFLASEPDPRAWLEPILLRATRYVPSVADAPVRGLRACARPQSVDGRPLVGRVSGLDGVFVCAGHGAWGISTGPASARLVADLMLHGAAPIDPELDPARFGPPRG